MVPSIIILALVVSAFLAVVLTGVRNRKTGKGGCSCGSCGGCGMACACRQTEAPVAGDDNEEGSI